MRYDSTDAIRTRRVVLFGALALLVLCGERLFAQAPSAAVYPVGHTWEGLPTSGKPLPVYHVDKDHPANRLHALLFLEHVVPAEIQSQLPAEMERSGLTAEAFYQPKWYFGKREGTEEDRKWFGGDVRVSPVREFEGERRAELLKLLKQLVALDPAERKQWFAQPLHQVLMQWDLMSVWWQLEKKGTDDPELLAAFAKTIQVLALPAKILQELPSGYESLQKHFASDQLPVSTKEFYLPRDLQLVDRSPDSPWVEIARNSSVLFQAHRSLHASRVYLKAGSRSEAEQLVAAVGEVDTKEIAQRLPGDVQTALVQSLVVVDDQLKPVATPVVDEVRVRVVNKPFELTADNKSSSRDGSSHWIYHRTRAGSVLGSEQPFRFVPDTGQSLFVEYGSLKHATYAAQCALCHRMTNNGGQSPFSIRSLSTHMQPRVAEPNQRFQLAEAEMSDVVEALKKRLADSSPIQPVASNGRLKPRPETSDQERTKRAAELREIYTQPSDKWPAPNVDADVSWKEIGLLPEVTHPESNPYNEAKEALGHALFFDPRLSGSGQMACASCHDPDLAWSDGRTTSFGHSRKMLTRNAPTTRFAAFQDQFFWDGRALTLEEQAVAVLLNPDEMHASPDHVRNVVASITPYQKLFGEAFGNEEVTIERVGQAIACFERMTVHGRTRFDAFMKGKTNVMSDAAIRGMDIFRRDARCMNCHHGPLFSDGQFHDVGLSYYGRKFEDLGRYNITGEAEDVGRFRTPTLRDVTATGPLMHNGLFQLPGVLNMYNAGMPTLKRKDHQQDDDLFPTKSPHLKPLGLNKQDLEDLAAFLSTLEEPKLRVRPPELPGLHPAP